MSALIVLFQHRSRAVQVLSHRGEVGLDAKSPLKLCLGLEQVFLPYEHQTQVIERVRKIGFEASANPGNSSIRRIRDAHRRHPHYFPPDAIRGIQRPRISTRPCRIHSPPGRGSSGSNFRDQRDS